MNGSTEQEKTEHWVPVDFTVTCKRCKQPNLGWQHSTRTKKYYLCVTRTTKEGKIEANRRGFHQCQENPPAPPINDDDTPF